MATLKVLGERGSKVEIHVDGYTTAAPRDPYDANWLQCSVEVDVGRFRGAVEASIMTQDFVRLADQVKDVLSGSSRKASFRTMEEALSFDIEVDRAGRAKVTGRLRDIELNGCTLDFEFENDLSFLEQTSEGLRQIVSQFPERFVGE